MIRSCKLSTTKKMPDISEEFVHKFHHLDGDLHSEQRKNLFKLLRKKNLFTNEVQLNDTLKNIQPKRHVEHLFYVDTLIYFKRTSELVEILKQGNEVYISKIFKLPWFFKEAFRDIGTEELVNEFLPCLSFVIRTKLLKWFAVYFHGAKMDKIFDCVLERYGIRVASSIFHACSSTKIVEVLSNDTIEIKLKPNQVKALFDKDLTTFQCYLKYYKNINGSIYSNTNVFKYIALKKPMLVLELEENVKASNYHLGRRTSKKIVDSVKHDIVKNVKNYTDIVKNSIIVRKLHGCFENVYSDLFPRKMEDVNEQNICNQLLMFYPEKRRWDLFTKAFAQTFPDKNIVDILVNLNYDFMKFCPETEMVRKWAEIKYEKKNKKFLTYFEPEKAIAILKETINVTAQFHDRHDLCKIMLDCCKHNNDMISLENVLQYYCSTQRNEPSFIHEYFLDHFFKIFDAETLSDVHWNYIKELLEINHIEGHYHPTHILKIYIEALCKNKKPFKKELIEFIKTRFELFFSSFLFVLKNPAVEKDILINIINVIPEVVNKEHEFYTVAYSQLVTDVVKFSIENKEYFINLLDFPCLVDCITCVLNGMKDIFDVVFDMVRYNLEFPQYCVVTNAKLLEIILTEAMISDDSQCSRVIAYWVTEKNRSEFVNEMLQCYFEKILDKHISHTINFWFMKNEPSIIYPYIDKIIKKLENPTTLHTINAYFHLKNIKCSRFNFEEKLAEVFKKQLHNPDSNKQQINQIIDSLLYLCSTEDLIDIVKEYCLPEKSKLHMYDKCQVAKSLKRVIDPYKMLPIIQKFTVDDYLASALPSLYSIFYRTPEKDLYTSMDILSKKAGSVRKHSIFLSCELLNYNHTIKILKTTNREKVSSEKYRYLATLKYFIKNPSHELLDLLVSNMNAIDKRDSKTFNQLVSIHVPKKYKISYLERCWQFFEDIKQEVKVTDYLKSILKVINTSHEGVLQLSPEFCKHVITSYLKQNEDYPSVIARFICNILRHRETDWTANFNLVFEIMLTHKHNGETNPITNFFQNLYAVASEKPDTNFIKLCNQYWNSLFTPIERFHEFTLLKLLLLKCEPLIEIFAKNVTLFLEKLVQEYKLYIYNKFKKALTETLSPDVEKKKIEFLYNLLKYKATELNCILVLDMIENISDKDSEVNKIFNDTLQIIKSINEPVVKLFYNSRFNS